MELKPNCPFFGNNPLLASAETYRKMLNHFGTVDSLNKWSQKYHSWTVESCRLGEELYPPNNAGERDNLYRNSSFTYRVYPKDIEYHGSMLNITKSNTGSISVQWEREKAQYLTWVGITKSRSFEQVIQAVEMPLDGYCREGRIFSLAWRDDTLIEMKVGFRGHLQKEHDIIVSTNLSGEISVSFDIDGRNASISFWDFFEASSHETQKVLLRDWLPFVDGESRDA
jgi:hypothetical protein